MRNALVQSLLKYTHDPRFVFLTGDLGYNCLEGLRDALGERFINCGVAEQNMVGVAAGLAKMGMRPWVYSISPFLYARAFEFIRNDVCYHGLPVVLVGNGAGCGYGVMGPTHHSLEDYGILLTLRAMRVLVPAFDGQIDDMAKSCFETDHPTWIRLGLNQDKHERFHKWHPWHHVYDGHGPAIVAIGDIAENVLKECHAIEDREDDRQETPSLWAVSEFPIREIPQVFADDVERHEHLIILEDHVKHGSIGDVLINELRRQHGIVPRVDHITADGPPYDSYGSREFHRKKYGLDVKAILERVNERRND